MGRGLACKAGRGDVVSLLLHAGAVECERAGPGPVEGASNGSWLNFASREVAERRAGMGAGVGGRVAGQASKTASTHRTHPSGQASVGWANC